MALTYTQLDNTKSFSPSSDTAWEDYDLYTNFGIPKNAVAEILLQNNNADNEFEIGVRANGSSLARKFDIHEAEGGGSTHLTLLVQTDADGKIEIYSEDTSETTHYVVGYFEGATYTETMDEWANAGDDAAWTDKDLFTDYSVPKGRVCEVVVENPNDATGSTPGVRTDGSAIVRYYNLCEAEGGGRNGFTTFVLSDATSGKIEYYDVAVANNRYYTLVGYFDANVGFTERKNSVGVGADATWEDEALIAFGVPSGAIVSILCFNEESSAENELGVRENGTALDRKWDEHESELTGYSGFRLCVTADASRIIELYEEDTSASDLFLAGWFTFTGAEGSNIPAIMRHYRNLREA